MRPQQGLDWVGGTWRPAVSGLEFELASLQAPYTARGRWPRSGEEDLSDALVAGTGAEAGWGRCSRGERVARLLTAVEVLERDERLVVELAAGLGLAQETVRERAELDLLRAREGLEILRDAEGAPAGTGLFVAHWSDLVGPLLQRVALRLVAGTPLVVLADPRLPEAADALARALEAADLPAGTVSVLHDDGRTVLRAALRTPGLAWGRVRATRGQLDELACEAGPASFGAGLTDWSLWPLVDAIHVVSESSDPVVEAGRVVERAFDPSATLSGQLPDAVGRVLCHQRRFSAFTEELLARLDTQPALTQPCVPVEDDLPEWMAEAWALGLDEGACPVFGELSAERRGRDPRPVQPLVFTNVETDGRLLGLERPAPLLRLARAASDEEAHRLRDALAREAGPARLEPHPESIP
jgi:acyl-CoA reductase-like NAD-dependent aldehyde dehydrogenase